jgi:hypothetical protein
MYRSFIKNNTASVSVLLFIGIFFAIQYIKPAFLYEKDGSLRKFGIGYKKKTVLPIWLMAIIIAILSYVFVMYYLAIPKLQNF